MKHVNHLGKDPILPLVLKLAIPTMIAQLVNVLYSIVDRMYIGNIPEIGNSALAGVGVCGPIVTLLSSFAVLVGLGGSPLLAMRMGEGKKREAEKILSNCFLLLLGLSAVLTLGFLWQKENLLMWFGASETTFSYANTYLTIYTAGTFFALLSAGMNSFIICQGYSTVGMCTVLLGALLNIILDPIFIYGFHMGIAGAAVATVLSQMASCVFVLCFLFRKTIPVRITFGNYSWPVIKRVLLFGVSPFIIIATDSVLCIVLNTVLQRYGGPGEGDRLITCATIVQSYMLLIAMPMAGITAGTQPILSFNYGAGHMERIRKGEKYIVGLCLIFTSIMMIITHTLSPFFVRLFTSNAEMLELAVRQIKIFTLAIIPLALQYSFVDASTALGAVKIALSLSLSRKTMFLIATVSLPMFFGAQTAFLAEPIADAISACITSLVFFHFFPKILKARSEDMKRRASMEGKKEEVYIGSI